MAVLGGAAATWPFRVRAQQRAMSRIGLVLSYKESDPAAQAIIATFRQELQRLGWIEGSNIEIDIRYAAADPNQIRALAIELMDLKPDLMVSQSNLVTTVLQSLVQTVPLLFISVGDPVGSGYVTNIARPSGNVTGFANWEASIGSKWLQTLREIAPHVETAGFILQPETPINVDILKAAESAAPSLKTEVVALGVHDTDEITHAVSTFAVGSNRGLIVAPHAITNMNRNLIIELSARYQLPAIYAFSSFARAGGLASYGFDQSDQFRQAATYVNRILRGAKIADLPVQYPTKLELVVNLKTATALGLSIPESFLLRAEEVIE
jgi:putative tryptophan/tyrosine transport system substrate-binding protein